MAVLLRIVVLAALACGAVRAQPPFVPFGAGCVNSLGSAPSLSGNGPTWPGGLVQLTARPLPAGAAGFFAVGGTDRADPFGPLPRDLTPLGMPGCTQLVPLALTLPPRAVVAGLAFGDLPIPPDPWLVGTRAYAQFFHTDPGLNRIGLAASGGLRIESVPAPNTTLSLMTYNIHHAVGTDGRLDLARIAAVIRRVGADLVALQEVDRNVGRSAYVDQIVELGRMLSMHWEFSRSIPLGSGEYGNGLLSRFPVASARSVALPSPAGGEARSALDATVRVPFGGGERAVRILATHLHHTGDPTNRLAQLRALHALAAAAPTTPTVLAGDLNATPSSAEITGAVAAGWVDTVTPGTPLRPTFDAVTPTRRIDYVMVRPAASWQPVSTSVPVEPLASDHRPAVATVRLR